MPDYTITPNPETHEFTVTRDIEEDRLDGYHCIVTLFPSPICRFRLNEMEEGHYLPCRNSPECGHIEHVKQAIQDARNAPETEVNRLMIETAYIPLKVAHKRTERANKGMSDSPIDDVTKRQDWMD